MVSKSILKIIPFYNTLIVSYELQLYLCFIFNYKKKIRSYDEKNLVFLFQLENKLGYLSKIRVQQHNHVKRA